ncbi:germ cell-specific gene 1-like protein [Heterodontus francisci]|uniref:germ cell-specific gene 1-like protein n=1 Tax=Heterodontus francisci TaxID=7792 RepID=UPI00355BECB3
MHCSNAPKLVRQRRPNPRPPPPRRTRAADATGTPAPAVLEISVAGAERSSTARRRERERGRSIVHRVSAALPDRQRHRRRRVSSRWLRCGRGRGEMGLEVRKGPRRLLSVVLNSVGLLASVCAFGSSYWCVGTHKVVKPPCLSAVKRQNCGSANATHTQANATLRRLVHYTWETGEDRFTFRYFHTGFWYSCEEQGKGVKCRSFINLTPESELGVLWFAIVVETLFIALLGLGFLLMCLELLYPRSAVGSLKINSFAAVFTVLSGLLGMVGHMMFTTVFHVTVSLGPKDWKPQSWDYGWSFHLAWFAFSCAMLSAVSSLNAYSKTIAQLTYARRALDPNARGPRLVLDPDDAPFLWERSVFSVEGGSDDGPVGPGDGGSEGSLEEEPC